MDPDQGAPIDPHATSEVTTDSNSSVRPRRGLHEDWTASLIGLVLFVGALLLALGTKPEDIKWDTAAPPKLTAAELQAGKERKSPWPAPLKGWITGKFSKWNSDPTAALRPKPKAAPKSPPKTTSDVAAKPEEKKPDTAADTPSQNAEATKSETTKSDTTKSDTNASDKTQGDKTQGDTSKAASAESGKQTSQGDASASKAIENPGPYQWQGILGAFIATLLIGLLACVLQKSTGAELGRYVVAFVPLFVLSVLSFVLSAQSVLESYNLEYALWALLVGLLIANTIRTPQWLKPAIRSELYIKIGLVLLGAEVLFSRLLELGLPGVFVSWVVTPIVLISTYIFGQKVLKMESRSLNLVISADMSVCGVSAAIATAAACKAKKEELSLAIGLSLIFTVFMMIVMPLFIVAVGMNPVIAGAWLGGTIDSTGAVAAAADLVGPVAVQTAITVKMIQNILIGITAICVAYYWTRWVEPSQSGGKMNVGIGEIWRRFPKFVIGFLTLSIIASVLFASAYYGELLVSAATDGVTKNVRVWLFCLAFVCIGLETNFSELFPYLRSGKPLVLYLCGQALNVILTLIMALIMFGWLFPPESTGP